jgi:uncharacterized protein YndB with AHSA1/START domain
MEAIYHQFTINAPANEVFKGIATPEGLDKWWTKRLQNTKQIMSLSWK